MYVSLEEADTKSMTLWTVQNGDSALRVPTRHLKY